MYVNESTSRSAGVSRGHSDFVGGVRTPTGRTPAASGITTRDRTVAQAQVCRVIMISPFDLRDPKPSG